MKRARVWFAMMLASAAAAASCAPNDTTIGSVSGNVEDNPASDPAPDAMNSDITTYGSPSCAGSIAVGDHFACALVESGRIWCWGNNSDGAIGIGTYTEAELVPRLVLGLPEPVAQLEASAQRLCTRLADGSIWTWGATPRNILLDDALDVACGSAVCVVRKDDVVACRGMPSYEEYTEVTLPGVLRIVMGSGHACARDRAGSVWCWGDNTAGPVGTGSPGWVSSPQRVGLPSPALDIAAGTATSCALLDDSSVWCWGHNLFGQVGDGTRENRPLPVRVRGLPAIDTIGMGKGHTCALSHGTAWCWGKDYFGQLGTGASSPHSPEYSQTSPVLAVVAPAPLVAIDGGIFSTCGLRADGSVWCWGSNLRGEAGTGAISAEVLEPNQVVSACGQ
jgi:alpha-tubulin suppressor-like RCC1 family protein